MPTIDYTNGEDNSANIVLTDNSTELEVDSGTATQSGAISESGGTFSLTETGAGVLILSGNNDYTGGTTIDYGGTLQLGDGGASGTLGTGVLADNGKFLFERSDAFEFANAITGIGSVVVEKGTLKLSGISSYLGNTIIASGAKLSLLGSASIAASDTGIADSGTLDISAVTSGTSIVNLTGAGTVLLGGRNSYDIKRTGISWPVFRRDRGRGRWRIFGDERQSRPYRFQHIYRRDHHQRGFAVRQWWNNRLHCRKRHRQQCARIRSLRHSDFRRRDFW